MELVKKFNILSLAGEFLLFMLTFVVEITEKLETNSLIITRHIHILHMSNAMSIICQKQG
jgi:hypothetical protein